MRYFDVFEDVVDFVVNYVLGVVGVDVVGLEDGFLLVLFINVFMCV